jgi:hypothetical protein
VAAACAFWVTAYSQRALAAPVWPSQYTDRTCESTSPYRRDDQLDGLLYRFALESIARIRGGFASEVLALSLAGLLIGPAVPNTTGRVIMIAPMLQDLIEALGYRPQSKPAAGLAMAASSRLRPNGSDVSHQLGYSSHGPGGDARPGTRRRELDHLATGKPRAARTFPARHRLPCRLHI